MRPTRQARRLFVSHPSCLAICRAQRFPVRLASWLCGGGSMSERSPAVRRIMPCRSTSRTRPRRRRTLPSPQCSRLPARFARLQQLQRLQAERRERGKPAANPHHQEDPDIGMHADPLGISVTPATRPITNDPSTLISSVPQGNRGPVSAVMAPVSQNRATLPMAPPSATASHVVIHPCRTLYSRYTAHFA